MSAHQMETGNRVWEDQQRQVHYLSMEFLMGRSLEKNAYNLGLLDTLKETLEDLGTLPPIFLRRSLMPAWATAAWAAWPPVIWTP